MIGHICYDCAQNISIAMQLFEADRYHKPLSETSKLKSFVDAFNELSGDEKLDVAEAQLKDKLRNTRKFSEDEIKEFIKKALQNGQIYERKMGVYAKA